MPPTHSPGRRLAVVIPTRNRPDLAANAVASIFNHARSDVVVLVSDNSTEPARTSDLARICELHDVPIVSPGSDFRMVDHWEWALGQALTQFEPTHVTFLTDRMVFRAKALDCLLQVMDRFPHDLIAYSGDRVDDSRAKVRLTLQRSTLRTYRADSAAVLEYYSRSDCFQWMLPRMLNSVTPVEGIRALRDKEGSVFGGVAPDYHFGYRMLAHLSSYVVLDAPLFVHYALSRSNGHSFTTGRLSRDAQDFVSHDGELRFATAFPDVITSSNVVVHEYILAANQTRSAKFVPIEISALRALIERDLSLMEPGPFRDEMYRRLGGYPMSATSVRKVAPRHLLRHQLRKHVQCIIQRHLAVDRLPSVVRFPRLAIHGHFSSPATALAVAVSLYRRCSALNRSNWPPGSRLCGDDSDTTNARRNWSDQVKAWPPVEADWTQR